MKNTVAIIGRPNTGKSTLFNKILGKRESITSKNTGTTRDIIIKNTNWQGINFKIFDTGGIDLKTQTNLEKNVQLQTKVAIKKANVLLFLLPSAIRIRLYLFLLLNIFPKFYACE